MGGGYGYGLGAYGHLGYAGYAGHPYAYGGYAHAGRYVAHSGGAVHIAKREADADATAEADADAYYGYYGHHYAPYAYGYAHRAYAPYAYGRYGYGFPYGYGK